MYSMPFRCRGAQSLRYRKRVYREDAPPRGIRDRSQSRRRPPNKSEWIYGLDTLYYGGSYYTFITTDNDGRVCELSLSFRAFVFHGAGDRFMVRRRPRRAPDRR